MRIERCPTKVFNRSPIVVAQSPAESRAADESLPLFERLSLLVPVAAERPITGPLTRRTHVVEDDMRGWPAVENLIQML